MTVLWSGDSIISLIACFRGFSSLQAASKNINGSTTALVIAGPSMRPSAIRAASKSTRYMEIGNVKLLTTPRESHQQHPEHEFGRERPSLKGYPASDDD
jgi:hypothetical protein